MIGLKLLAPFYILPNIVAESSGKIISDFSRFLVIESQFFANNCPKSFELKTGLKYSTTYISHHKVK
jgi:hypothetical protein